MELELKINTKDSLSLAEAKRLQASARRKRISTDEVVVQFIREGLLSESKKKGGAK